MLAQLCPQSRLLVSYDTPFYDVIFALFKFALIIMGMEYELSFSFKLFTNKNGAICYRYVLLSFTVLHLDFIRYLRYIVVSNQYGAGIYPTLQGRFLIIFFVTFLDVYNDIRHNPRV